MQALLAVLIGVLVVKTLLDYKQGEKYMARLDTLNAALDNIDTATTELATQLTELAARVAADDISPEDLQAAVDKASALATRVSDASASVAGIEPTPVAIPDPVEEIPTDGEVPEPVPGDGEPAPEPVPGDGEPAPVGDNGVAQPGA